MKAKVLVTSLGASPAIDVCRCLGEDPEITIVGADASREGQALASQLVGDVRSLPQAGRDPQAYVEALERTARDCDFIFVCLDVEIEALVRAGRYPRVPNPLAPLPVARTVLDKYETVVAAGCPDIFPRTRLVESPAQFGQALEAIGGEAWIRPSVGTSGAASLHVGSAEEAQAWVRIWERRGQAGARWVVQEFLPGRNLNFTALFFRGQLIASAQMLRLEYYLGTVAVSGVTGQVRRAMTLDDGSVTQVSLRAIRAIDREPHGLYSVDLREDRNGDPKVNEINPRMAGRPSLFAKAGVNLPLLALEALLGGATPPGRVRAAEPGWTMLRQLDLAPVFLPPGPAAGASSGGTL